jgi:CDGSH-type Zn-finger protein
VVTIRLRKNGPYVIESDDVRVIDWNGAEYRFDRQPIALCRCGGSTNKPFCDGTHSRIGFSAAEAAVPGSVDKPAT